MAASVTRAEMAARRPRPKSQRLEARATEDEVAVIARAAGLLNVTLSAFVVGAAVEKAETVVARAERTIMPTEQFDAMIAALDDTTVVPDIVELSARRRRIERR